MSYSANYENTSLMPIFELTSNEIGKTVVDLGEDGEVEFHPEQQDVVLGFAAARYKEGLRGEALRSQITADLMEDMTERGLKSQVRESSDVVE